MTRAGGEWGEGGPRRGRARAPRARSGVRVTLSRARGRRARERRRRESQVHGWRSLHVLSVIKECVRIHIRHSHSDIVGLLARRVRLPISVRLDEERGGQLQVRHHNVAAGRVPDDRGPRCDISMHPQLSSRTKLHRGSRLRCPKLRNGPATNHDARGGPPAAAAAAAGAWGALRRPRDGGAGGGAQGLRSGRLGPPCALPGPACGGGGLASGLGGKKVADMGTARVCGDLSGGRV